MFATVVFVSARYLPWFLDAVPSEGCAKGGAGAYNNAIQKDPTDPTGMLPMITDMLFAVAAYWSFLLHCVQISDVMLCCVQPGLQSCVHLEMRMQVSQGSPVA